MTEKRFIYFFNPKKYKQSYSHFFIIILSTMRKFNVIDAKKRILAARKKAKVTQEELGGRFGMSRAGFSAAENPTNDKVFFTPEQLMNIKYELGVTYDYIFEGLEAHMVVNKSTEHSGNLRHEINEKEIELLRDKIKTQDRLIESLYDQIKLLKGG